MSRTETKTRTSTKSASRLRQLGSIEMYQSGLHNLRHYCGTIVTCRYVLPPSLRGVGMHKDVVQTFERAVAQTVIRFPMLQVGLVGESSRKPSWVSLPNVNLAHHITWKVLDDDDDYDEKFSAWLQYQLDTKFDNLEARPGWRLLIMRTTTGDFAEVMFVWNHANCDGMSGKIFHQNLLQCLNAPDKTVSFQPNSTTFPTAVTRERLPPPQEKVAKHPITMGYALSETWNAFGPSSLSSKVDAKASWAPVHLDPYVTKTRPIIIANDTLKRILGICRKHDTTLTGLLHGIALVSLATYLPKEQAPAFSSGTAMDQRRFMTGKGRDPKYDWYKPHESIQNCVSSIYHTFGHGLVEEIRAQARVNNWKPQPIHELEKFIWSAAKMTRDEIEQRLELGTTNSIIGMMKLVRDWQEYHREHEKKARALSWIITNIGVIDGQPKQPAGSPPASGEGWSIDDAKFTLSADVAGPFLQISAVSVKGGNLSIHICWQDSPNGGRIATQIAKDMEAWLNSLGAADYGFH